MPSEILYDVTDGIATITLNRPDRLNAFTVTMMKELLAAFDEIDADDAIRAVIMTGAGRAFCAGADLAAGRETFAESSSPETGRARRDAGGIVSLRIFELKKPIIAAINGPAVGVGITMTLPMDIRLMSEDARVGFVFAKRGIVPEACSSWFLPRVVGISTAMEWVATGRMISAAEAAERGLARSVHPATDLLAVARSLAAEMSAGTSAVSVALSRQLMWRMLGASHPMEAHRADSQAMASRGRSADAAEGVTSFLEKRPAVFADRVSSGLPDIFSASIEPTFEQP